MATEKTSQTVGRSTQRLGNLFREGDQDRSDELAVVSDINPPVISEQDLWSRNHWAVYKAGSNELEKRGGRHIYQRYSILFF